MCMFHLKYPQSEVLKGRKIVHTCRGLKRIMEQEELNEMEIMRTEEGEEYREA